MAPPPSVAAPAVPRSGALAPLGVDQVHITGGFWGDRQRVNRDATLPHIESRLEREGWLGNFDLAARGGPMSARRGREFADSEIYKWLEAVAWQLGVEADAALEHRFRAVVGRVAAAQEPDGYLSTAFGRPGQPPRWSDLEWGHELYCLGHLFQAAVARERTRPGADDGLLGIARRAADRVCETFGPDGIEGVCGHPEIEVALAELGRLLDEPRYTAQAALFVDRRGRGLLHGIEFGAVYFQDDVPVRDAEVLRGHAVRANYLAAGAVDVAVDSGDAALLAVLRRQWAATVARRTYLTGGQGSHHQDEAFGADWELPPDRAYSETCAGIGSIMFSWRLLLATGDPRYADLIERTLFNVVATSPSADGRAFYYANTLHQRDPGAPADPDEPSGRASSSLRAPWFEVSCCPPNVARTLASLAGYVATSTAGGVQVHQYADARIAVQLAGGPVRLAMTTAYPADGEVVVRVVEAPAQPWTLTLRVPAWADGATVEVDGPDGTESTAARPGVVELQRTFAAGTEVRLQLPMRPRITRPDPRIDAVRGSVAIERGPEVLCLESVDVPIDGFDGRLDAVAIEPAGVREEGGRVLVPLLLEKDPDTPWPYAEAPRRVQADRADVPLIPYHSWAERGPSTMRVWLPAQD